MAIARAAERIVTLRRINKRKADKYIDQPAYLGEMKVVTQRFVQENREMLIAEGFDIVGEGDLRHLEGVRGASPAPTPQERSQRPPIIEAQLEEVTMTLPEAGDDLEAMSRDDLKALADQLGIQFAPNLSTKNLISLIRQSN